MSTTAAQQKGTRSRAKVVAWAVPLSLVLLIATVLLARWLRFETSAGDFIAAYSGEVHLPGGSASRLPCVACVATLPECVPPDPLGALRLAHSLHSSPGRLLDAGQFRTD